jgi:phage baseplate assembly protein W
VPPKAPVAFPYAIDGRGRTAEDDPDAHVRALIELVLFTAPGERVMRPTFGSGLLSLVFEPNSDELVATTQFLIVGALQQVLGDIIDVASVDVQHDEGTLRIAITYVVRATQTGVTTVLEHAI